MKKELEGFDWLSTIGLIGDSGGKENREFVVKIAEKYGVKLGKDEFLYDNDFGNAAFLNYSRTLQDLGF